MFANLAESPVGGFANLLSTSKNIKKFKNEIPPIEAITDIVDAGTDSLSRNAASRIELTVIYDSKLKNRMAQASEEMFKQLCNKANNDIDKAKLNAYSHYAMFFIEAPVVIAVISKTQTEADLGNMTKQMQDAATSFGLELYDLYQQLSANKDFSQILNLEKPAHVITLLAVGFVE